MLSAILCTTNYLNLAKKNYFEKKINDVYMSEPSSTTCSFYPSQTGLKTHPIDGAFCSK